MRSEFPLSINAKSFCSPPPQWVGNCQVTHNIWQSWLSPESHTPPQSQCYRPNSIPASSRTLSTSLAPVPNCIHYFHLPPLMHRSEGEILRNPTSVSFNFITSAATVPHSLQPRQQSRLMQLLRFSNLLFYRLLLLLLLLIVVEVVVLLPPCLCFPDRMDRARKWAAIVMRASNAWAFLRRCRASEWKIRVWDFWRQSRAGYQT